MIFLVASISTVVAALGQTGPLNGKADATSEGPYAAMVASTTLEWGAAFAARGSTYAPPRIVFLRTAIGHPARGAGYSSDVGLVLDLGDLETVSAASGADGPSMAALIVAHEVGHHVQHLMGDDPEVRGAARELQADCLAGWWMAASGNRARAAGEAPPYPVIDLTLRLPQAIERLEAVQAAGIDGSTVDSTSHGSTVDRISAFAKGMSAPDPWICLWGQNP